MKEINRLISFLLWITPLAALPVNSPNPASWQFEVVLNKDLAVPAKDGRLFVILARGLAQVLGGRK